MSTTSGIAPRIRDGFRVCRGAESDDRLLSCGMRVCARSPGPRSARGTESSSVAPVCSVGGVLVIDKGRYFHRLIFPVLTPLASDTGRPFPHISNLSLSLAVLIEDGEIGRASCRERV